MTLNRIKNYLKYAVPEELYQIEKGQIVFFVPDGSIHPTTMSWIGEISQYLWLIDTDDEIAFNIVPTRNKVLMNTVAGRKPQDTGSPCQIMVCTYDTIAGLAAEYHGVEIGNIIEDAPKADDGTTTSVERNDNIEEVRRYDIDTENLSSYLPAIVTINPANRPVKEPDNEPSHFYCPFMERGDSGSFVMQQLTTKPVPGTSAERKLIQKEENKLEKILRECAVLGIELDIDKVKKKFEDDLNKKADYKLRLDIQFPKEHRWPVKCAKCDIYVADGEEYKLDMTAIEKAVYLSFLLFENGITILDAYNEIRETTKNIYTLLPDKNEKDSGGITDDRSMTYDAYMNTLRGYLSNIRAAVAEKVSNPVIAQEFAIEGFKNAPYGIERTTAELREQIRREFHLD